MSSSDQNIAESIINFANSHGPVTVNKVGIEGGPEALVAAVPQGKTLQSLKPFLDEFRLKPERHKGIVTAQTLQSLIDYSRAFGDEPYSAIFADVDTTSALVVFNYHDSISAGWADYGVRYEFPKSDQWKVWAAVNKRPMSQKDFAWFLDSNILDVVTPPRANEKDPANDLVESLGATVASPQKLMEVARNFQVNVNEKVVQAVTVASGEVSITYDQTHNDKKGLPIKVPNLFFIGIPVFVDGVAYRLPVRLRYALKEGEVTWTIEIHNMDRAVRDAFKDGVDKVAKETTFKTYFGKMGR